MKNNKVDGQYVFYYKNGHLCRFNLDKDNAILERKQAKAKRKGEKAKEKTTGVVVEPIKIDRNKKGIATFDSDFKKKDKVDEIRTGGIIKNKFHKSVHHLKEKDEDGTKNPDILTDGKYSEIKTSSGTSVDKLVRKGLKQVNEFGEDKAGDVYLNLHKTKSSKQEIDRQIRYRLSRSSQNKKTKVIAIWKDGYIAYRKK